MSRKVVYNKEKDCYYCPMGQAMRRRQQLATGSATAAMSPPAAKAAP